MFSAVGASYLFLKIFTTNGFNAYYIALLSAIGICVLAILGIMENDLRRFLGISNIIQISFVVLSLSITKMAGQLSSLSTTQIFNYTLAGLLLFLSLGVFAYNKKYISELEGSQINSRWNDAFCAIACLSLAGLPGLNMFVSEWNLVTTTFTLTPGIVILEIIAVLLLFIMYYKLILVLLVGDGWKEKVPKPLTIYNAILTTIILTIGLFPQLQWLLFKGVFG
jgi:formate hydrogenlyase subunit 3/multisubunit Na+/H+ antiporter MnhD subunit